MAKLIRPADKKAKEPTYTGKPGEPTPIPLRRKHRAPK